MSEPTYVVVDGRTVEVEPGRAKPIPTHDRPDGGWCRWSGANTLHPAQDCPDRCLASARQDGHA